MRTKGQKAALATATVGSAFLMVCGVLYGAQALAGIVFGLLASFISIGSLWLVVALLSQRMPDPRQGAVYTVGALVLKLPILVICLYFGTRLPQAGLACFLATIGLVYSVSIWFLAASD